MIKVLVTGGAGFIGSNFVRYALDAHPDWHITNFDKLTYAGRMETLRDLLDHPRHAFVRGDVTDRQVAAIGDSRIRSSGFCAGRSATGGLTPSTSRSRGAVRSA